MAKPLVGITTYVEQASWGSWTLDAALIPYDYVRAVEHAGGRALLVPPSVDGVEETLDALDGLVLSGGNDVDPEAYGAEAHSETNATRPERDRGELALLEGGTVARTLLGDEVVDHYLNYARTEQRLFDETVTCYERERMFERG